MLYGCFLRVLLQLAGPYVCIVHAATSQTFPLGLEIIASHMPASNSLSLPFTTSPPHQPEAFCVYCAIILPPHIHPQPSLLCMPGFEPPASVLHPIHLGACGMRLTVMARWRCSCCQVSCRQATSGLASRALQRCRHQTSQQSRRWQSS
jgi:hypothetical protein